jgi:hypothetical protein
VPGIATIYRELLSEAGEEICKLLVTEPVAASTRLTFGQLLSTLYQRDDLLLLAVELEDPRGGGRRLVVNPRPGQVGYRFAADELVGIFAIGDYTRMPRAPRACEGCFAAPAPDEEEGDDRT